MKKNSVVILIAIIAVLTSVSLYISSNSSSNRSEDVAIGQKMLPTLFGKLNDINSFEISNSSGTMLITKSDAGWVIPSKDNYPANVTQIRKNLMELANLEKVEAKTKKEKNYSKLGVQTNIAANSKITLKTATGILATIIIGNKKSGHTASAGGLKSLYYARLQDDAQAWLTSGSITIPLLKNYMSTELSNIAASRIKSVEIKPAKGSRITIHKKTKTDTNYSLKQLKKNKELANPNDLNQIASVLANFKFDDVTLKKASDKTKKPLSVKYSLFNGLEITLTITQANSKFYLQMAAEAATATSPVSLKKADVENQAIVPDAKQEAAEINKKHAQWLYKIPNNKGEILLKSLNDLVKTKAK
ncbi:hypothetical protein MNBD_GAMMA22-1291 [hydrothermal vent metagenome]|uniref:DUF4340 domain-containing protein n=1 Tax=hydrothermal vent metagenome TaxID=652676 RepID=A0A3B1AU78_9ZZZZ